MPELDVVVEPLDEDPDVEPPLDEPEEVVPEPEPDEPLDVVAVGLQDPELVPDEDEPVDEPAVEPLPQFVPPAVVPTVVPVVDAPGVVLVEGVPVTTLVRPPTPGWSCVRVAVVGWGGGRMSCPVTNCGPEPE